MTFKTPPTVKRSDGEPRRVGFELEFTGLTLQQTSEELQQALGGAIRHDSAAEHSLETEDLGTFNIELDWSYLKRKAEKAQSEDEGHEWVDILQKAATLVVPMEVVCPPIAIDDLGVLDTMVESLREAGAKGTEDSLIAAFGVHINPEIPSLDATTIDRYLKAFALLQWWLVRAHQVDVSRRLSPYVDLYPEAYLEAVLEASQPDMDQIISTYLEHNATRNRALDMLPMLAEIDGQWVRAAVDDDNIKARPTFHYRLPNCLIEMPGWSLASSWNLWWVVEQLAEDPKNLASLGRELLDSSRLLLGVNRKRWTERMQEWLGDQGWV